MIFQSQVKVRQRLKKQAIWQFSFNSLKISTNLNESLIEKVDIKKLILKNFLIGG